MRLIRKYQTLNPAFTRKRKCTPVGIFVHSTGSNNPYCSRYVDWVEELGPNKYGNHWNKPEANKAMHAFVGYSKDRRDVVVVETLPYSFACMGAGGYPIEKNPDGSVKRYRSANYDPQAHIQFEICEDGLIDPEYYRKAMEAAEEYCAHLCRLFNWDSSKITSHYEAAAAKMASNHGDPRHWMIRHGDSMNKFRARVQELLDGPKEPEVPKPEEPAPEELSSNKWHMVKVKLTRQENADYFKKQIGDVVELPIEKYLLGVVPSEIPQAATAPLEACKAQAIVARTIGYARTKKGEVITDESGVHQAYRAPRGVDGAYNVCHRAVSDTKGVMLYFKNKVADSAVYSHSNGGEVRSPKDAGWPGTQEYLVSKNDPYTLAPKNGHGVGLSQVGAVYMAKQGMSYSDILSFYYPGTFTKEHSAPLPVESPDEFVSYFAEVVTKNPNSLGLWSDVKKTERRLYIPRGETVEVIGHVSAAWAKVRYKGVVGFVDRRHLSKVAIDVISFPYKAEVVTKNPNSLGIWANVNKTRRLAFVPRGAIVDVYEHVNDTFAKVKYSGTIGVSDRQYLKVLPK